MTTIIKALPLLTVVFLAGCETTAPIQDNWTYYGSDEALRMPPRIPRGELSSAAWMAKRQDSEAAWWQERERAIEQAKEACARETGESKIPGYWMGYGRAFSACMRARGWSPGRSPI